MMIEAVQVSKRYDTEKRKMSAEYALESTTLSVDKGEMVILTGKSGSGKTTLLHIMAGLLRPSSGYVLIEERDIYQMNDKELSAFRNRKIGVVPQGEAAIYSLTVEENIKLPDMIYGRQSTQDIDKILKDMDMYHKKKAYPGELSGGELRRMSIARAIYQDTDIILADEPTSDLDDENTNIVIQMLRRAADKGKAVFVVTHETDLLPYADRHYIMKSGQMTKV